MTRCIAHLTRPRLRIRSSCLAISLILGCNGGFAEPSGEEVMEDQFFKDFPIVISPTHLVQPLADSPVAVTVIDRELIDAMGVRQIPDLLRRVVGYVVAYESNLVPVVSYHGLNGGYTHRMQVLIDGRSVYDPVFGGVHWATLPLVIEDIERIEVVRGPNAATDGANAFLSTISIITRQAAEDRGTTLQTRIGNNGIRDLYIRQGQTSNPLDYRLSAAFQEDQGVKNRYDSQQTYYLAGRLESRPSANTQVSAQIGYKSGDFQYGFEDPTTAPSFGLCFSPHTRPIHDGYAQLRWEHNPNATEQTVFQTYFSELKAKTAYQQPTVCGGLWDERTYLVRRYDADVRRRWTPFKNARLVVGAGARLDQVEAFDQVDGFPGSPWRNNVENQHQRIFGNLEYRFAKEWLLNMGGLLERHSLMDGEVFFSPRIALNYHLTDAQTLRFGWSRAVRIPSFLEETWNNDLWAQKGGLAAETIESREIGYLGQFPDWGLRLDLRIFRNRTRDLLNIVFDQSPLQTLNGGYATITGFEAQTQWDITSTTTLRFAYAFTTIDSDNPFNIHYTNSTPRHISDLFLRHQLRDDLMASLGFNYVSNMEWLEGGTPVSSARYLDFHLARKLKLPRSTGTIAFTAQNLLGDQASYLDTNIVGRQFFLTLKFDLN